MSNADSTFLFVYGTLMRGGCRAGALVGQRFVGEASTEPRYRMVNCGTYPGLLEASPGRSIYGEVWEVKADCLPRLDEVEGVHLGLYERRPVWLRHPFADRPVEAYFYLPSTAGMPDCGVRWINDGVPLTDLG